MAKVKHYEAKKAKGCKTSMEETDGIMVEGTLFVNDRIVSDIADRCDYLITREARHKTSLLKQGYELSRWKDIARKGVSLINRQMNTMNVQDNAILYWYRAYGSAVAKFRTAMGFAVTMILLVAGLAGFIYCRESGIRVPFIDRAEAVVGGHESCYIQTK